MCEAGHEGIIAKLADRPYRRERTKTWLKIKCLQRQEFVIGGWRPSDKKRGFASLLLGTWEDGKLIYRGRVGTGFNAGQRRSIQAALDKRARDTSPSRTCRATSRAAPSGSTPELVGEIAYTEITPDGILRHPSFIGLREDKPAKAVKLEVAKPDTATGKAAKPGKTKRQAAQSQRRMELTDEMGIAAAERWASSSPVPTAWSIPTTASPRPSSSPITPPSPNACCTYVANRPLSLVRAPAGVKGQHVLPEARHRRLPRRIKKVTITETDGDTRTISTSTMSPASSAACR